MNADQSSAGVPLAIPSERDRRVTRRLIDEFESGRGREHSSEDFNWLGTLLGRLIARREQLLLIIEKDSIAGRAIGRSVSDNGQLTTDH